MKTPYAFFAALLVAFGTLSCGSPDSTETAENETITADTTSNPEAEADDPETSASDLILYTFMNNEMQAALARTAQEKASSQSVKDLGQTLVTGNKEIAAKLDDLAKAAEVQLPGGLEVEQQNRIDSVEQLTPEEFDKAYVDMMVKQQKENIDMLEDLSAQAENAIVRGLASDIIDIQQTQIEESETVQQEIGS